MIGCCVSALGRSLWVFRVVLHGGVASWLGNSGAAKGIRRTSGVVPLGLVPRERVDSGEAAASNILVRAL